MRAAVYHRYGAPEVVTLVELPKPVPADDEVLIRTRATTVTSADWRARSLTMPYGFGAMGRLFFGISAPRQPILGSELAGDVEAVGKDVRGFKVGDAVFAFTDAAMGCHAEYKCVRESAAIAHKPANLNYDEAAALSFGGTTALSFLRRGKIRRGDKVLVNGASSCVGTAAVQLTKHFGADVTGVCSTANLQLVQSIGADRVIDYTQQDFASLGETYDLIVDSVGTAPFARSDRALAEGGRLLQVLGTLPDLLRVPWIGATTRKKVIAGPAIGNAADLQFLAALAEAGEFTPVIDQRYSIDQIVEAHRRVDTGRKRGNVVVTFGDRKYPPK